MAYTTTVSGLLSLFGALEDNTPATAYNIVISDYSDSTYSTLTSILQNHTTKYVNLSIMFDSNTSTSIHSFQNCTTLVGISNNSYKHPVGSIEEAAFKGCTNLTSINLRYSSLGSISSDIFSECSSLKNISVNYSTFSAMLTALSSLANSSIESPYNITIYDITDTETAVSTYNTASLFCSLVGSYTSIYGSYHFSSEYITKFNITQTRSFLSYPTIIGLDFSDSTCETCSGYSLSVTPNLTTIDLGSNSTDYVSEDNLVYSTDYKTLVFCPPLYAGEAVINDTVETINEAVFSYRQYVTNITLPKNLKTVYASAFKRINADYDVIWNGTDNDWVSIDFSNAESNPMYCRGSRFYKGTKLLTKVDITTATAIKQYVFTYCKTLTTVYADYNPLTVIGAYAFHSCTALTEIALDKATGAIEEYAFYNCTSLPSIKIPSGTTSIGENCFFSCIALRTVSFPDSLISIGMDGFLNCTSLVDAILPISVTTLEDYAFKGCTNLSTVYINNSSITLGSDIFDGDNNITLVSFKGTADEWCTLDFPTYSSNPLCGGNAQLIYTNGTSTKIICSKTVKKYAFYNYKKLEMLAFFQDIEENAVTGCTGLTELHIEGSPTDLSGRFENLTALKTVYNMPSSVTDLTETFSGCTALTDIHNWQVDPDSTTIDNCFTDCTALENIYVTYPAVKSSTSDWQLVTLDLTETACTLTVYSTSLSDGALVQKRATTVTYSGDKKLTFFNMIDELAGASDITEEELINLLTYNYPLARKGQGIAPSNRTFVLWAADPQQVQSNVGNNLIALSSDDFDLIF